MKKTVAICLLICVLISVLFAFSGCGLFDSVKSDNNNEKNETKYEFSIQYEDELTNYSFTDENSIKVSPRYKEGYTLEGFFTLQNGNGTKMIDWNGTCLSSSFSGDGSTVLYPYYKNIDYSYVYEGPVWYDENPKTASYNVYGDPQLIYGKVANLKDIDYILKVANSNPDLHFNLTAKAYLYDDAGKFYVGIGTKVDKSNLLNHISFNRPSSYTEMTVSAEIRGKALTIDDTNVIIGVFCTKFGHAVYFKNLQIEISIIEP